MLYDPDRRVFKVFKTSADKKYIKEKQNIIIKAVKFRRDGFYTQPFVFGGEEGPQNFDPKVRYRGSLQNYLIDTGNEVILIDIGYKPEQVTKILLTHKHGDHSGELRSFPNAKIFGNEDELSADELQDVPNLVPVSFTDGAYFNFPKAKG